MKTPMFASAVLLVVSTASTHAQAAAPRQLTHDEQVAHVLSRLTFGARPGDVARLRAIGVDRWIDEQLRPSTAPDSALLVALAPLPPWSASTSDANALRATPTTLRTVTLTRKDSTGKMVADTVKAAVRLLLSRVAFFGLNPQFVAGKVIHAEVADRQLEEVMTDFWQNHFSVYSGKMPSPDALVTFERDVLRPRVLGKFRDLLGAVAHSPAMLFYLDNHLSAAAGLNENYARELLELHTLGVDGGYTQQDVIEVARALTGWSIEPLVAQGVAIRFNGAPATFAFRESTHDRGAKTVLGHTLAAERGVEDGEDVLDIVARHPSTARFIATKLARRFVSDDPPPALIDRAAATFTRTDGDIAEVVRTIVTSPEFFSRAAFRSKVKTPFELVVSARRAVEAPVDATNGTSSLLQQLGQPIYGRQTPEGWPDYGGAWINSGTMLNRMRFASNVATNALAFLPSTNWRGWTSLADAPLERQVDGVINLVLGGVADRATRDLMLATPADTGTVRLRELLTIALGSPDFQRR